MMADEQFLAQLRCRDESAVVALVEAYYARVERYLARLVGDPHLAADLAQDTFVRAYERLPELRDADNLAAWLFQIATNLARSHERRRRILAWLPLQRWQPAPGDAEHNLAERDAVGRALAQLSSEDRACLLLHVWGGLRYVEIAALRGTSEAAVKMRLLRARRQFRQAYEGPPDEANHHV